MSVILDTIICFSCDVAVKAIDTLLWMKQLAQ